MFAPSLSHKTLITKTVNKHKNNFNQFAQLKTITYLCSINLKSVRKEIRDNFTVKSQTVNFNFKNNEVLKSAPLFYLK